MSNSTGLSNSDSIIFVCIALPLPGLAILYYLCLMIRDGYRICCNKEYQSV